MALNRILPDTCAWIDFFNGNQTVLAESLAQALVQREVMICGIIICELLQGVKKNSEEMVVLSALRALPHLEMTRDLWVSVGQLSATLRKSGYTLPMSDIIIATLAMHNNCAVLTVDRHFAVINGLKTI